MYIVYKIYITYHHYYLLPCPPHCFITNKQTMHDTHTRYQALQIKVEHCIIGWLKIANKIWKYQPARLFALGSKPIDLLLFYQNCQYGWMKLSYISKVKSFKIGQNSYWLKLVQGESPQIAKDSLRKSKIYNR